MRTVRNPYVFLPKKFKEAVARGWLHVYCEFCVSASRVRGRCTAGVADPAAAWRDGECPRYAEIREEDWGKCAVPASF